MRNRRNKNTKPKINDIYIYIKEYSRSKSLILRRISKTQLQIKKLLLLLFLRFFLTNRKLKVLIKK